MGASLIPAHGTNPYDVQFKALWNAEHNDDGTQATPLNIGGDATDTGAVAALTVSDQVIGAGLERTHIYGTMFNPVPASQKVVANVVGTGRGLIQSGVALRGVSVLMQDHATVTDKTITGCASAAGLVRVTCAGHGFSTGDRIIVYGVVGATEANGAWAITVIDSNHFDLVGSTFSSAYVSGGTVTNRPSMQGVFIGVSLLEDRNGGLSGGTANADDVVAIAIQNESAGPSSCKPSEAIYIAASPNITGSAWQAALSCDANADWGVILGALGNTFAQGGIDLSRGVYPSDVAIRLPNSVGVYGRNNANSGDVGLFRINGSDRFQIETTTQIVDAVNIVLGGTTGTQIGTTSSQKLAFYGITPVVQPATTGTTTGYTAATGTAVLAGSTFTGNTGSTAYTVGDIVNALKKLGLLAA
jgi:hypothetical protein